jgi:hypothetical protein
MEPGQFVTLAFLLLVSTIPPLFPASRLSSRRP